VRPGNEFVRLVGVIIIVVVCLVGFIALFPQSGGGVSESLGSLIVSSPPATGLTDSHFAAEDPAVGALPSVARAYESDPHATGAGLRYWTGSTVDAAIPAAVVELAQLPSVQATAPVANEQVQRQGSPYVLADGISLVPQQSMPTSAPGLSHGSEWTGNLTGSAGEVLGDATTIVFTQGDFVVRVFLQHQNGNSAENAERLAQQEAQLLSTSKPIEGGTKSSKAVIIFFSVVILLSIGVFVIRRRVLPNRETAGVHSRAQK